MARSYRQFLQDWKDFRCDIGGYGLTIYGEPAPDYVLDCLAVWLSVCYDVVEFTNSTHPYSSALEGFKTFGQIVLTSREDLALVWENGKKIDEILIRHLAEATDTELETLSFKHLGVECWTWWRLIIYLCPLVRDSWAGRSLDQLSLLRTCLLFPTRLNYVKEEDAGKQVQAWKDVQHKLALTTIPDVNPKAVSRILGRFHSPTEMIARHGSGSVSTNNGLETASTISDKYRLSLFGPRLQYLRLRHPEIGHPFGKDVQFDEMSKLTFVPKQLGKYRAICMEPPAMQWAEQAFKRELYHYITRDRYVRQRIPLLNQEVNREFAREGSIDGGYATIDLSHASDSVSKDLVKKWFRRTELRQLLSLIRTPITRINGVPFHLACHATMGSAVTFPLECLVFAIACEHVILSTGRIPGRRDYSIYGDDIVIRQQYAGPLMDFLEKCGFEVNREKSFTDYPSKLYFRESCGGFYVKGFDVTPVRVSRRFHGLECSGSPEMASELISLANSFFGSYPKTRGVILRALVQPSGIGLRSSYGRYAIFQYYETADDSSIWSYQYTPDNHHLPQFDLTCGKFAKRIAARAEARSRDLQRTVLLGWAPVEEKDPWQAAWDDEVALYEWLRFSQLPYNGETARVVHVGPKGPIRDGWRESLALRPNVSQGEEDESDDYEWLKTINNL